MREPHGGAPRPSAGSRATRSVARLTCIASASLLGAAQAAHAAEIPKINVTEAGPERDIPLGSFYLSGTADADVTRIQAFVVRTSMPWLFGGNGPTCEATKDQLKLFQSKNAAGKKVGTEDLPRLSPGTFPASSIWMASEDWQTLIPAAWEKKPAEEGKEATFNIFVGGDDFFVTGASYCVLLYKEVTTEKADRDSVAKMLDKLSTSVDTCAASSKNQADVDVCIEKAITDFEKELASLPLPAKTAGEVAAAARAQWEPLRTMASAASRADKLLNDWSTRAQDTVLKAADLRTMLDLKPPTARPAEQQPSEAQRAADQLALAIGELLVQHNKLDRFRGKLYTRDGKIEVASLQLNGDFTDILVADANAAPGKRAPLGVGADALRIPAADVTLRDLLELTRKRIRIDDEYMDVSVLQQRLHPILLARDRLKDEDRKVLDEAAQRFGQLARYIHRALLARTPAQAAPPVPPKAPAPPVPPAPPKAPEAPEPPSLDRLFGDWLFTLAVPCDEAGYDQWIGPPSLVKPTCGKGGRGWPGHPGTKDGPIALLATDLQDFQKALDAWTTRGSKLVVTYVSRGARPLTRPFSKRFAYTQSTWLFSYATPVVGYGVALNAADPFNIFYYGLQVHLVPNPVQEPLWTHGPRDVFRAFALELGMSLPATTYGPGERFRGWKGLPPLFLGATFHALPYAGVSAGGVLLERRSSPLEQEAAKLFISPYVGMNVQINIPDLLRNATTSTTTKTE
ncbi:hypothetical protein [Sorangium sp. So ce131]|uniref:hypothetical protein n=1 Tax=Sorangium sp. So ce131 TaxID=3133282 RepID=UPI003F601CCC